MGDMAEDFKALREHRKAKRKSNLEKTTNLLKSKGVSFESKNNGVHLIVKQNEMVFDFYPSTGLFIDRTTKKHSRGVFHLLKKLGATQ